MTHFKGLLRGAKFSGTHTTVIPDAIDLLTTLKRLGEVTKISVGLITPCKVAEPRVKVKLESHALKLQVRGRNAVQVFYVYGSDLPAVVKVIEACEL